MPWRSIALVPGPQQVVLAVLALDKAGVDGGGEGRIVEGHRQVGSLRLADFLPGQMGEKVLEGALRAKFTARTIFPLGNGVFGFVRGHPVLDRWLKILLRPVRR